MRTSSRAPRRSSNGFLTFLGCPAQRSRRRRFFPGPAASTRASGRSSGAPLGKRPREEPAEGDSDERPAADAWRDWESTSSGRPFTEDRRRTSSSASAIPDSDRLEVQREHERLTSSARPDRRLSAPRAPGPRTSSRYSNAHPSRSSSATRRRVFAWLHHALALTHDDTHGAPTTARRFVEHLQRCLPPGDPRLLPRPRARRPLPGRQEPPLRGPGQRSAVPRNGRRALPRLATSSTSFATGGTS